MADTMQIIKGNSERRVLKINQKSKFTWYLKLFTTFFACKQFKHQIKKLPRAKLNRHHHFSVYLPSQRALPQTPNKTIPAKPFHQRSQATRKDSSKVKIMNIHNASEVDLQTITKVGESTAERIFQLCQQVRRGEHPPVTIQDLENIRLMAAEWQDQLN